ncbi:MAG: tRNA (adenosine(37)-N6)-dimethylallyltransferase MiaA [Propylenella sp.]
MELSWEGVGAARAVLIAGPTASGKSALALRLAEDLARHSRQAFVVNADALQVYDALRVVTARPTPAEEARITHRLYGHVPAETRYSVGAWLADVEGVLREADEQQALAIVVGGTGLYFKALTEGIAAIPPIPADVRERFAERLEAAGVATLHAELLTRDPASAALLRPGDAQRILRALEVLEATGTGLSAWQLQDQRPPLLESQGTVRVVLETRRPILHTRIEERFDRMVGEGAVEEVRALVARGLDPQLPVMKAIGVREFAAHLRGAISLDAAVAAAKTETRRYAKRQSTWLRNQMSDWPRSEGS